MENQNVEKIKLDEKAIDAIAEKVAEKNKASKEEIDAALAKQKSELEKDFSEREKVIRKNVKDNPEGEEKPEESAQVKFVKACIALKGNNTEAVKAYNEASIKSLQKANYNTTGVNADGGYVVPDATFEAEVEKLTEDYGVAFREADVRPISTDSIKTNRRGSNVTMYEIGQGVRKPGTKLTIEQIEVSLRKFAAIAIATDELVEDSAIDWWNEVTQGFAEERARIADEMVFTDTNSTYPGILRTPGVPVISVGSSVNDFSWDDLMDAEVTVPTLAARNGKHYMHRTFWNIVRKSKDSENRYQLVPSAGLVTPWGTPVVLVDVMPSIHELGDANEPFAVFGDLKRIKLYVKRGLQLAQSSEATVYDTNGDPIDLYAQDMSALRAVTRMVSLVKFKNAFCLIGIGTVS